MLYKNSF